MEITGEAFVVYECEAPLRSWAWNKQISTPPDFCVRLNVQFPHNNQLQSTAPLAVWAYIGPSEAMQHAVLLRRDSWMRFSDSSCRTLAPPRPSDSCVLGRSHAITLRATWSRSTYLFPMLRPPLEASTSSMQAMPASRYHATNNSSKSLWVATTVPRPAPAATSSICCTLPTIFRLKQTLQTTVPGSPFQPAPRRYNQARCSGHSISPLLRVTREERSFRKN